MTETDPSPSLSAAEKKKTETGPLLSLSAAEDWDWSSLPSQRHLTGPLLTCMTQPLPLSMTGCQGLGSEGYMSISLSIY